MKQISWKVEGFYFLRTWRIVMDGRTAVGGRAFTQRSAMRKIEQALRLYALMNGLLEKKEEK